MSNIVLSVIIPTFNSERTIDRLLRALFSTKSIAPFEVIIVDGYSSDRTVELCQKYNVRLFYNSKIHAAAARNIGIEKAFGTICAFIDSDCVPCADWINILYQEFLSDESIAGIGGKMEPLPPNNDIEYFTGNIFLNEIMKFPDEKYTIQSIQLNGAFITANCAYKKEHLLLINGFKDFFSNHGEDIDLFWRSIQVPNAKLVYYPKLLVYHSFPDTINKLIKKYFQYGIASSKLTKVYSKKTVNIDLSLYKKLVLKLITLFINPRNNSLYLIQLLSHLTGKYYGSMKYKTLNI